MSDWGGIRYEILLITKISALIAAGTDISHRLCYSKTFASIKYRSEWKNSSTVLMEMK